MNRNPTKAGRIKLGQIIEAALESEGITQKELIERLATIGHNTTKDKVSRLVNAIGNTLDGLLLLSIADLGICRSSQGEVYSLRDLMLIACESGDESKTSTSASLELHPSLPLGIVLLSEIKGEGITVEEFARRCNLTTDVLRAVLEDRTPLLSDQNIEAIAVAIASMGFTPEGVKKLYLRSQIKTGNGKHK